MKLDSLFCSLVGGAALVLLSALAGCSEEADAPGINGSGSVKSEMNARNSKNVLAGVLFSAKQGYARFTDFPGVTEGGAQKRGEMGPGIAVYAGKAGLANVSGCPYGGSYSLENSAAGTEDYDEPMVKVVYHQCGFSENSEIKNLTGDLIYYSEVTKGLLSEPDQDWAVKYEIRNNLQVLHQDGSASESYLASLVYQVSYDASSDRLQYQFDQFAYAAPDDAIIAWSTDSMQVAELGYEGGTINFDVDGEFSYSEIDGLVRVDTITPFHLGGEAGENQGELVLTASGSRLEVRVYDAGNLELAFDRDSDGTMDSSELVSVESIFSDS